MVSPITQEQVDATLATLVVRESDRAAAIRTLEGTKFREAGIEVNEETISLCVALRCLRGVNSRITVGMIQKWRSRLVARTTSGMEYYAVRKASKPDLDKLGEVPVSRT